MFREAPEPPKMREGAVRLLTYLMQQDDPKRCTSRKLCRLGLARPIYRADQIPKRAVVLNPEVGRVFSPDDRHLLLNGLVAIDCSWKRAEQVFSRRFRGFNERLPLLVAANSVNYGRVSVLSSAEALAAALYIANYKQQAERLLSVFKWGPGFLKLNREPLEDYTKASSVEEVRRLEKEYFPDLAQTFTNM